MGSTVGTLCVVAGFSCAAKGCLSVGGRLLIGYAGVPKPGDEERSWSFEPAALGLNTCAGNLGVDTGSSIVLAE